MSLTAMPVHVALVDTTGAIGAAELTEVAGALNEQVQSDFAPVWHVRATVGAFTDPQAVSPGTWRIEVDRGLDEPGALGYHADQHNQPYSKVEYTPDWTVTASHELLEMLADPWGNRMHAARLPLGLDPAEVKLDKPTRRVHYLVEVCDPPEARSYEIGGVAVSDFLHPHWYRTNAPLAGVFSQAGGVTMPRQVADGGYVSFCTSDGEWWQLFVEQRRNVVRSLGRFDQGSYASIREFTDEMARSNRG